MKKIWCLVLLLFCFSMPAFAQESPPLDVTGYLDNAPTQKAGRLADEILREDDSGVLSSMDFLSLTTDLAGNQPVFDSGHIVQSVFTLFFRGFRDNATILLKLCAICVLSTVVMNLYHGSEKDEVGKVALFVFYALCAGILLTVFSTGYELILKTTNQLQVFLNAMLGAMMAVGAAGGSLISAGAFYPVLLGLCGVMGVLQSRILLPLFCLCSVLTTVNHLSDSFHLKRFCALADTIMKWLLTFVFLLFVGVITVKGVVAAPMDALSSKAIKFAASSFVPVVGGVLSDAVETVAGAGKIIKNSLGAAGIIAVAFLVVPPILKLLSMVLLLKLSAALLESVCDNKLTGAMWDMGSAIGMGVTFLLVYSVVFVIAIASFICVTGTAMGG